MRSSDQAVVIGQQFQGQSIPQSLHGIVSPCSSCLNQRAIVSTDGKPACPRRAAAATLQQAEQNNFNSSGLNLVVLTGKAPGQEDDGTMSLANPVYDSSSNSILVWVAAFKDNGPTLGSDGTVLSPDILDPKFSSDWIQCRGTPFTPRDPESHYFQKGCLMEGDQVDIVVNSNQQVVTSQDGSSYPQLMAGTVSKINAIGQNPLQPVNKDLCVSGT